MELLDAFAGSRVDDIDMVVESTRQTDCVIPALTWCTLSGESFIKLNRQQDENRSAKTNKNMVQTPFPLFEGYNGVVNRIGKRGSG